KVLVARSLRNRPRIFVNRPPIFPSVVHESMVARCVLGSRIMSEHHRRLEAMYRSAPTNRFFSNLTVSIAEGTAEVAFDVRDDMHHAAGALHGCFYFKPLDDAAFFAANSLVADVFVLTAEFTVQFFRPVVAGRITAKGQVTKPGKTLLYAQS